ncbi:MAG: hypothetical protein HQ557_14855 [Bacteroidetes bacterium]|nr:hypothetical protein [Bacteroidota bacterium]
MNIIIRTTIIVLLILSGLLLIWLITWNTGVQESIIRSFFVKDYQTNLTVDSMIHILYTIFCGISFFYGLFLFIFFRKTTSPEILYLIISVLSFAFLSLRFPISLIIPGKHMAIPPTTIIKSYYFFYLFSISLFFLGGLFSNGIPFLKQNTLLSVSFFISFIIALIIPLNYTGIVPVDPPLFSYNGMLSLLIRVLEVSAVINYLAAAKRNNNIQYILLALSLLLLLVGLESVYSLFSIPVMIAGVVLYLTGLLLFANRIYKIRLWN